MGTDDQSMLDREKRNSDLGEPLPLANDGQDLYGHACMPLVPAPRPPDSMLQCQDCGVIAPLSVLMDTPCKASPAVRPYSFHVTQHKETLMITQRKGTTTNNTHLKRIVVWAVGGNKKQSMDIFARWKKAGIIVARWWSGDGRVSWEKINDINADATHMLLMTRWMGHRGDDQVSALAKDTSMRLLRLAHVDVPHVRSRLGMSPVLAVVSPTATTRAPAVPPINIAHKKWTVMEMLLVCRFRAAGKNWNSIGTTLGLPPVRISKQHSGSARRYGGANVMHALLEGFVASGNSENTTMYEFSQHVAATEKAAEAPPVKTPAPPQVDTRRELPQVDTEEVEEALAMAVRHSDRADKAEATLKTTKEDRDQIRESLHVVNDHNAELIAKLDASRKQCAALLDEKPAAPITQQINKAVHFGWHMSQKGIALATVKQLITLDRDALAAAAEIRSDMEKS